MELVTDPALETDGLFGAGLGALSDVEDTGLDVLPSEYVCEVCAVPLTYSGRGRKPRYCSQHKGGRTASAGTSTRAPAKRKRKGAPNPWVEGFATMGWGVAGMNVQARGVSLPSPGLEAAGRVMQVQAPDAGVRLARLLEPLIAKLTFLQHVSDGGPWADVAALVLPPLVAGAFASLPDLQPVLGPILTPVFSVMAENVLAAEKAASDKIDKVFDPDPEVVAATQQMLDTVFGPMISQEVPRGEA